MAPSNADSQVAAAARTAQKSARSRPRSSLACVHCRQKKIKCNVQSVGIGNPCAACRSAHFECVVTPNGDRRKHGSREHISVLQDRIDSLESRLGQFSNSSGLTLNRENHSQIQERAHEQGPDSIFHDQTLDLPQDIDQEETLDRDQEQAVLSELGDTIHVRSNTVTAVLTPPDSLRLGLGERRPSAIDEVRPTLDVDTDSRPGHVRYYGPTTQLYLQSGSTASTDTNDAITDFPLDMESLQLRDTLVRLSWTYYARSVSLVDEQLFMSHRAVGIRSQYWSNFLECSLLACATRLRGSRAMRPLGRAFAERAKNDMIFELENPTIATLQGLLLLSEFEATSARDRIGWTYSGIACRMLFDLGLHEDCSKLIENGTLNEADGGIRTQLFLSSFVHDHLWALYLGRPYCIPLVLIQQCMRSSNMDRIPITLRHWVHLCSYIAELTDMLNGFGAIVDDDTVRRLSDLSTRIDDAHKSLPLEYSSLNTSGLHEIAYGLNMQFCGIQIILHRAIVKVRCGSGAVSSHGSQIDRSRRTMDSNAMTICRLALAYREIFGIETFITVMLDNMFIAVGTLISHVLQPPNYGPANVNEAVRYMRIICETFEELQRYYPVAEKMRHTLRMVTENTVLAGVFNNTIATDRSRRSFNVTSMPPPDNAMPPPNGSWGSVEALLNDDFLLSHGSLFGDGFNPNNTLDDSTLMMFSNP